MCVPDQFNCATLGSGKAVPLADESAALRYALDHPLGSGGVARSYKRIEHYLDARRSVHIRSRGMIPFLGQVG
jgi:hypothetical protein